jgi:hypothetical protein
MQKYTPVSAQMHKYIPVSGVEYDNDIFTFSNSQGTTSSAGDEIDIKHCDTAEDISMNDPNVYSECLTITVKQQQETISALYSENTLLQCRILTLESEISTFHAKQEQQQQLSNQLQAAVLMQDAVPHHTRHNGEGNTVRGEDDSMMLASVEAGDIELFCTIIRSSSSSMDNMDVIGRIGGVALLLACQNGHFKIAEFLLDKGVSAHVDRDSPLQWAAQNGDVELAKLLLKYGADPKVLNNCPLRIALRMGHVDMVNLLNSWML